MSMSIKKSRLFKLLAVSGIGGSYGHALCLRLCIK